MDVRLAAAALALALPDVPALLIPQDPTATGVDAFEGRAWRPRPLRSFAVPRHPFMAPWYLTALGGLVQLRDP